MSLNVDKYLPYLKETTLSDEQKEVIIRTVWQLMESQVYQAFNEPYQANNDKGKDKSANTIAPPSKPAPPHL